MKRKHTFSHLSVVILWLLAGFLLLFLGFCLFCFQLTNRIQYVSDESFPTLSQKELDEFLNESVFRQEASDQVYPLSNIRLSSSKNTNILLIGQDRREGEVRSRADAMILCTLCKSSSKLVMTSFLRDLYVQIPGYRNNRLNAAYAAGGMPLLKRTFQENFGVAIDGCIEVDFRQFSQLIDKMGGIRLQLRQDEAALINETLPEPILHAGFQLLCGDQALAYARIRNLDSDGDFSRTERQRKIIQALLQRCQDTSLPDSLGFIKAAMPMLTTDMPRFQLLSLAREFLPRLAQMHIVSQHIPVEDSFSYEFIQGMSVLVADMGTNRQFLEEQLLDK